MVSFFSISGGVPPNTDVGFNDAQQQQQLAGDNSLISNNGVGPMAPGGGMGPGPPQPMMPGDPMGGGGLGGPQNNMMCGPDPQMVQQG